MLQVIQNLANRNRWKFLWRYLRGNTPWDTNITPPEVQAYIEDTPPGRALDLGCGTGTNAMTLARRGWQVTGVDFVPGAIQAARAKAEGSGLPVDFWVADVTRLDMLDQPFDYVLDIGCLFSLDAEARRRYSRELTRLAGPGGCYMLYAWLPRTVKGRTVGLSAEELQILLGDAFEQEKVVIGEEKGHGSAWYWYRRT